MPRRYSHAISEAAPEAPPGAEAKVYEEWVAHPNKRSYALQVVHSGQADGYASQPGWWASGWLGDADAVEHLTHRRPQPGKPVVVVDKNVPQLASVPEDA